jgi:hypothetical protein
LFGIILTLEMFLCPQKDFIQRFPTFNILIVGHNKQNKKERGRGRREGRRERVREREKERDGER